MITTSQKISGFLSLVIPISTITIAPVPTTRFAQLIQNIGNASSTPVQDPNFGMMLWNLISVYPDALGQIAWVILFHVRHQYALRYNEYISAARQIMKHPTPNTMYDCGSFRKM